jgi:hypothetical protein
MFHGAICGSYLWADMILLDFFGKFEKNYLCYFLGDFEKFGVM